LFPPGRASSGGRGELGAGVGWAGGVTTIGGDGRGVSPARADDRGLAIISAWL
jgi:hypothetical protein